MRQIESAANHSDAATALDRAGADLQRQLLRLRRDRRGRDCYDIESQLPNGDTLGQALLETGLRIRRKA